VRSGRTQRDAEGDVGGEGEDEARAGERGVGEGCGGDGGERQRGGAKRALTTREKAALLHKAEVARLARTARAAVIAHTLARMALARASRRPGTGVLGRPARAVLPAGERDDHLR
jgi:hypothetical protein